MTLQTGRFTLRLLRAADAAWIAREIAVPEVQMWLTSPPHPYRIEDAEAFVAKHYQNAHYRVIERSGRGIGVVTLTRLGAVHDLGYWLSQAEWGRGVMTECATALLDWHFDQAQSDVTSGWITGNAASRGVLTKLGFRPDGTKQDRCQFRAATVTVEKVRITAAGWTSRHA